MTCTRCLRRERYQQLVICENCARDLVAQKPIPKPEWVRRMALNAKILDNGTLAA